MYIYIFFFFFFCQMVLHVKEKLWFVQAEKRARRERSDELDASVPREQEALTQTMQARDLLRFHSLRMRRDCGLLGNPTLLRDLEDTEDEREALRRHVEELKRHADARRDTRAQAGGAARTSAL